MAELTAGRPAGRTAGQAGTSLKALSILRMPGLSLSTLVTAQMAAIRALEQRLSHWLRIREPYPLRALTQMCCCDLQHCSLAKQVWSSINQQCLGNSAYNADARGSQACPHTTGVAWHFFAADMLRLVCCFQQLMQTSILSQFPAAVKILDLIV